MKKTLILVGAILLGIFPYAFAESFHIDGPAQNDIDTAGISYVYLNSAQSGIIQDINVSVQISTPYADDLTIYLIHGSANHIIYNGVGDTPDSYINAVFDDEASGPYPQDFNAFNYGGHGTAEGTFRPFTALSLFDGLDLFGQWRLGLIDTVVDDDGTDLLSWHIEGTVAPIPEPTTMLLLGSGLIGLAGYGRKKFFRK